VSEGIAGRVGGLQTGLKVARSQLRPCASLEVFLWDDFHYRHLISDLSGIQMSNGFNTTRARNAVTTWSRMGRAQRDDVQREFDPASNRHGLRGRLQFP
jgi:hypothetical protein